jgi:hypothetical protein
VAIAQIERELPDRSEVVGKAVLRSAELLGLSAAQLGRAIGLSEASVSRLKSGTFRLEVGSPAYELSLFVIRVFRSLDSIVGGDKDVARSWMKNDNTVLGARPCEMITSLPRLVDLVNYLDSRRALV